uniref:Telomere repeat binding bouquet formation protein 1 n=1 Tax=Amphiprion percula TaxID=161767 RepID=A0A3P8SYE8_AMPPE
MKCPELQKQALLTIHSICQLFIYIQLGGVVFVHNLSKSSVVHSEVKETALFTLGTLAEANVYCKNSLCRKEIFLDLAGCLMKEDIPLTQKRVSVYLLFVLVFNNVRFCRTTFPLSTGAILKLAGATQTYQLWTSVSSALCGCVNNPRMEGQRICVAAFPIIKVWLQQISLPRTEIFQPICSFIAMTVANNSCVQESFSASEGLETLTLALVRLASAADTSLLSCQLSVIISKTLSACITDNSTLALGLAQYGVVSHLFCLLASPHLDPEDRLSVLLTLGHCTEASEEHQSQLVQCGGLPLVITLLAEDTSEEVKKAATFVLQACKQASKSKHNNAVLLHVFTFQSHSVTFCILTSCCVLPFEEVTSRTFATLQSSCQHSCDMHKVLEEATEKFRRRHCSLFLRKEHHDNTMEYIHPERAEPRRCSESWRSKKVDYLLSGVKKYGFSWNSILWSYPFKPGRTNVGLAKKYSCLP